MEKVKEKLLQKQVEKLQNAKNLNDFISQLDNLIKIAQPLLKAQGIEAKVTTAKYEGKIWKAILLRETKDAA